MCIITAAAFSIACIVLPSLQLARLSSNCRCVMSPYCAGFLLYTSSAVHVVSNRSGGIGL